LEGAAGSKALVLGKGAPGWVFGGPAVHLQVNDVEEVIWNLGPSQTLHFILAYRMNRGRAVAALARFARWQVQSRLRNKVLFDCIDGAKLAVRRGMTGATDNFYESARALAAVVMF
jgi:hypothetical protein